MTGTTLKPRMTTERLRAIEKALTKAVADECSCGGEIGMRACRACRVWRRFWNNLGLESYDWTPMLERWLSEDEQIDEPEPDPADEGGVN